MNRAADVVVIGAGTAGLAAFHLIERSGKTVLLIEGGPLGTMCARVGCMPSKAVLRAGERMTIARGVAGEVGSPRTAAIGLWCEARAMRDELVAGVAHSTTESAGDRLIRGCARFVDRATIEVNGITVTAKAFVVACGSRPVIPDFLRPFGSNVLTTDTLFDLDEPPESIGVLGLGAVGLEMSVALARLGVRTVAADKQAVVAGLVDPVVNARAVKVVGEEVLLWLGDEVSVTARGDAFEFRSSRGATNVDRILAALGRAPVIDGLNLQAAGVALDDAGKVELGAASTRCKGTSVFLAGDVSPDRPLQHEAVAEGQRAAKEAIALVEGASPGPFVRATPLSIVFTDPDIGQVGKRLDELDSDAIVIGEAEGKGNGRSRIMKADGNLVRVYVDRESRKLEGAALCAVDGEHLSHHLAWAVQRQATIDELLELPYYHPSVEEMLQAAFRNVAQSLT